jgi:DUF4097 and DUF4098 domain-containing protein YvlB
VSGGSPDLPVAGRAILRVTAPSGRVRVIAEARDGIAVLQGAARVDEADPMRLHVDGTSGQVDVRVPLGTDVVVGAASGRVTLKGRFGAVSVAADSGRVEIDHAETIDVRAGSGRVDIGRCEGLCRIHAGSGRADIHSAGPTELMVDSGSIRIEEARGSAQLRTTSGRIEVALAGPHDVEAESVSGRVRVTVPSDVRPHVILSSQGRTTSGVPVGEDSTIRLRSISGRLEVVPEARGNR